MAVLEISSGSQWELFSVKLVYCDMRTASFTTMQQERCVRPTDCSLYIVHCLNSAAVTIFNALHGMQTCSSDENSVFPCVCLSVKRVDCDKTEEQSVQIFIPYE